MRYFGEVVGDAPVYSAWKPSLTPAGKMCMGGCGREIAEGDQGFLIPSASDEFTATEMTLVAGEPHLAWHRDCLLEALLGPSRRELLSTAASS